MSNIQLVSLPCFPLVKRESAPALPSLPKPTLTEEEMEKKSNAIIEEYLHINDVKVHVEPRKVHLNQFLTKVIVANMSCFLFGTVGGLAVCGRAQQCLTALYICAQRC